MIVNPNIVVLDRATLGDDLSLSPLFQEGNVTIYDTTKPEEVSDRIKNADIVIINKIKLNASTLSTNTRVKLICIAATGFDNVDIVYCKEHNIGVCNVVAYSTQSVAQLTIAMALSLFQKLRAFTDYVNSNTYSNGNVANCLTPYFHEIAGKTWGILGYGNIGRQVGKVASALGCRVIVHKRTPIKETTCVDLDTLCRESDILSIHVPLNEQTKQIIDRTHIAMMKKDAILINVARGNVTDEEALAEAILGNKLGGIGIDVYSSEPFKSDHPFTKLLNHPSVLLTPHMAWGAFEARKRCLDDIILSIQAFKNGVIRSRVDI